MITGNKRSKLNSYLTYLVPLEAGDRPSIPTQKGARSARGSHADGKGTEVT